MIPSTPQTPPIPPSVGAQQAGGNPMTQFMETMQQPNPLANGQGDSMGYVAEMLTQMETLATQVAQVLSVEAPDLMPYLKVLAQAGSQLSSSVMERTQGSGAGQGPAGQDGSAAPQEPAAMSMSGQ